MRKLRKIVFYVLVFPVISLLAHNIIPHEHHLSCPEHEDNTKQSINLESIHHCCDHAASKNNSGIPQKSNCVLTSLPPVFYSIQPFLYTQILVLEDQILPLTGQNNTFSEVKFLQNKYFSYSHLRAPPVVLI